MKMNEFTITEMKALQKAGALRIGNCAELYWNGKRIGYPTGIVDPSQDGFREVLEFGDDDDFASVLAVKTLDRNDLACMGNDFGQRFRRWACTYGELEFPMEAASLEAAVWRYSDETGDAAGVREYLDSQT